MFCFILSLYYSWVLVCAYKWRVLRRSESLNPRELELQEIISCLIECWRLKLQFSVRTEKPLNQWVTMPVLLLIFESEINAYTWTVNYFCHVSCLNYSVEWQHRSHQRARHPKIPVLRTPWECDVNSLFHRDYELYGKAAWQLTVVRTRST